MKTRSLLLLIITFSCTQMGFSQCLAPATAMSSIRANPEEAVGSFSFNYLIKSDIEMRVGGGIEEVQADYWVNTTDGSMFFPKAFAMINVGRTSGIDGELEGMVIAANGQRYTYYTDAETGRPMVKLTESNRSAEDAIWGQLNFINDFFENASLVRAEPVFPEGNNWGNLQAYEADLGQEDGSSRKTTMWFARNPGISSIATSKPLVGYLVGIVKDTYEANCNRLAVHTNMELPSGRWLRASLQSIEPNRKTFDASDYETITLGGMPDTAMHEYMATYQSRMADYNTRLELLERRRERCAAGDEICSNQLNRQIEQLREDIDNLNCEMYEKIGVASRMPECMD